MCITFDLEIMNTIFTVDVEGHIGKDPVRRLIYGETAQGQLCGIDMLMDMLDSHSIRGLFFVDIAEAWDYGKEPISKIIRHIHDRGHDVGVHIHPDHMMPSKKKFLFEYSDEEQYEIIRKCTELYSKILGKRPSSFRAGKYSANRKTLDILAELGYKADFSQFFGYKKWCHINPPVTGDESVLLDNGLIEYPVMSYNHVFKSLFNRYDKLDINCSRAEHKKVLKELISQEDINVIVMFVHSFSLLNWRRNVEKPTIDYSIVKNLRYALEQITENKELTFSELDELLRDNYKKSNETSMIVPTVSGANALRFYAEKGLEYIKVMYYSKRYGEIL